MIKKMMKMILCMLLTVAVLSGCMRVEESFEVTADGKVKFKAEVLYEKQKMYDALLEMAEVTGESISVQEINEMLEQQGYQSVTKDGKEYYMAPSFNDGMQDISDLKEFYQDVLLPETETEDYISLTETSFEAAVTTGMQDMTGIYDTIFGAENLMKAEVSVEYEMMQKYLEDSEMVISMTFATPIEKASEGAVLSDDRKTISFSVSTAEKDTKEVYAYCENDIALDGVKSGIIYGRTVTYTIPEGVKATLNGSAVQGTVSSEKTGMYELCLKASDGTQKSVYYGVDKEGPALGSIKNSGIYNSTKVITISDTSGLSKVTVDGKDVYDDMQIEAEGIENFKYLQYSYMLGSLKEGKHTLEATDKLGNKSSVTFRIDKTAPKVTGVKNSKTYKKAVTIKVTDSNGVKSITLNGKNIKTGKKVSKKGSYKLIAKDAAGNKTTVKFKIKK